MPDTKLTITFPTQAVVYLIILAPSSSQVSLGWSGLSAILTSNGPMKTGFGSIAKSALPKLPGRP